MKNLSQYIKENLDVDNFEYKFDVWFNSDKSNLKPILDLMVACAKRKLVQKDDVEKFLAANSSFKLKKFVDFFDEDVKRSEEISVDYIYLFTKIIQTFISNYTLFNKVDYMHQAISNGEPNVEVDVPPMAENDKEEN